MYLPEKPKHVDQELKNYSKMKLPHFFKYAKDKEDGQVNELNTSTVNKLEYIIPNKPIRFKNVVGTIDYKVLMNNNQIEYSLNEDIVNKYKEITRSKKMIVNNNDLDYNGFNRLVKDELSKLSVSDSTITDNLIHYLYSSGNKNKDTLWDCYGDIIYYNIENNLGNSIQCETCTERFEQKNNKHIYCEECKKQVKLSKDRERKSRK